MAPEALKKGSVFERRNEEIRMHLVTTSKVEYVSDIITYFVIRCKIGKKTGRDHRHIESTNHLTSLCRVIGFFDIDRKHGVTDSVECER